MQATTLRIALLATTIAVVATDHSAGQIQAPSAPRDARAGQGQAQAVGTGVISGTVVVASTGQPARGARVTLSGNDVGSRSATANEQGQFSFALLPPARYSLSATKPGHLSTSYGQARPGRPGTPIQLADGQQFSTRLAIHKGGVLTGTILDEHGEAIPGTQVRVMRYVMQSGQRTLQQNGGVATDDRGIYRAYGLQPGDYIVAAAPRNNGGDVDRIQFEVAAVLQQQMTIAGSAAEGSGAIATRLDSLRTPSPEGDGTTGYAPVYFPGTTSASQAQAVTLGPGEEKAGIDFQLVRVAVARIEGTVVNATGQPLQRTQVMLMGQGSLPGLDTISASTDAEGRFRLSNVAPGQYTVVARSTVSQPGSGPGMQAAMPAMPAQGRGSPPPQRVEPMRYWANADVSVDGRNITNLMLTLQPGLTLSGRILFDGAATPPADLTRMRVTAMPAETGAGAGQMTQSASGTVDASGRFSIRGIVPGRYRLNASGAGQGWTLESAVIEGQDTLDFPLEIKPGQGAPSGVITFSDRQADLSGTLVNERGQPAPEYTVVLYPSDPRYWSATRRIRTARPATDGRFQFGTVAPGDYQIAQIFDPEPGAWFDPAFLQQLDQSATRVTIRDGEKKIQALKVSTPPR